MKAPKSVTERKSTMTNKDKESEAYARKAQTGDLSLSVDDADAIIKNHNLRPGIVALITRSEWLKTYNR